jgi:hypothetical protein
MNTRPDIIVERPYPNPYPNPYPFPIPGEWWHALGGFAAGVAVCALAVCVMGDKADNEASAADNASDETADASATVTD